MRSSVGVGPHSPYERQLAKVVSVDAGKDAEIRQLKRDLARMTEKRDILKSKICDGNVVMKVRFMIRRRL